MNDLVRFATSVELATGKKRGRHPVFSSSQFYPYAAERRLQNALRNELEDYIGAAYGAAIFNESFKNDSLEELTLLPDGLSDDFKAEISYAAESIARKVSSSIAEMTEMTVGKPYYPQAAKESLLKDWESNFQVLCVSAESDAKKDIARLVTQAKNEGWNGKQLEKAVMKELPDKYANRASLIARTESAKLNTSVTLETYKEIGCQYYMWMATLDERVRPDHAMMNGLICSATDPTVWYEENPDDPMHPIEHKRDDTMVHLHPGEDFQCRCTMVMWDPAIDGKYDVKEKPEEEKTEESKQRTENDPASLELEKANQRLAEQEKELETTKAELKSTELKIESLEKKNEENAQILERGNIEDKIKIVKKDKVLKSLITSTPQQIEKIAEALRTDSVLKAGVLTEKVDSTKAVERLCKRIIEKNPKIIGVSVEVVEFSEPPKNNSFIGMKSEHLARRIHLNSVIPLNYDTENLSPKKLLFSAFEDLRHGRRLSLAREYAIESFYHEILHLNAKGWELLPENSSKRLAMELMNQFVSRHYYHEFIEAIGGRAVNQNFVIKNGSGYGNLLKRFNRLLKSKKMDGWKIAEEFRKTLLNKKYGSLESYLDKFLKDNFEVDFETFIGTSQSK